MAQKVLVQLVDDLDGGEADDTVTFGLDGTDYEMDLSDDNAKRLRESLVEYIASARRLPKNAIGNGTRRGNSRKQTTAERAAYVREVREWARRNGKKVSGRGRIPVDIIEEYESSRG